jgi:hypothetical protein
MSAVSFFAGGWGYLQLVKLPAAAGPAAALPAGGGSLLGNSTLLLGLAALLVTAVLAGLLSTLRAVSPLAAGLPGAVLLAWTALYLVSVRQAVAFIPLRSAAPGAGWQALLFHGVLGAAGAVMVFPLFMPSRGRAPVRAGDAGPRATAFAADEYLSSERPETSAARPGPATSGRAGEPALVGNVMSHPGGRGSVRPVDTSRVTGASRALRATGSFRAATGSIPRAAGPVTRDTGSYRRDTGSFTHDTGSVTRDSGSAAKDSGYFTRDTGSFGAAADGSRLGRPYYQGPEQSHEGW